MAFYTHVPAAPLSQFIELLWMFENEAPQHARERVLPTGGMQMVIGLHDDLRVYDRQDAEKCDTFGGSLLYGAHTEYVVIGSSSRASLMGVHFRPGGAFPFFRMPAGELQDIIVGLDDLWGAGANDLREQLLAAPTRQHRFAVLERAMLRALMARHAARPVERHRAVAFALREFVSKPNIGAIAGVTRQIGLGPKRFSQVFRDEVGLTPKVFTRIQRFQTALRRMEEQRKIEWADVALDCGYFDQPHFIHDFRGFSGLSPSAYIAHRTPQLNHVPLLD